MQKIARLIQILPNKDPTIAKKFLDKRDFNSLKELVWSDIVKITTAQMKEDSHKYDDIEVMDLLELMTEIDKFTDEEEFV